MLRRAWPLWLSSLCLVACGDDDAGTKSSSPPETRTATVAAPGIPRLDDGETLGAKVLSPVALRDAPGGRVLGRVGVETEFDSDAVLAVMEVRGRWLGVHWPSLANGELGWVRYSQERLKLLREPWQVRVDLSDREAVLLKRGEVVRTFPVAVGKPGTDTPPGRYGVTDRLDTGGPGSPYGCCVLALSGHQPDVPQDWPGGDRLAIHGTTAPSSIGTAASNGCLRASEEDMRVLMERVPLGAQVVIRA